MTPATIAEYERFVYSLLDSYPSLLSSTLRVVRSGPAAGRVVGTLTFAHQVRLEVAELVDFDAGHMEILQYGYVVWRQETTTPKVKRRLATHVAPERPKDVTAENRKWLASAAIQQGGHREQFLVELGNHLDGQGLDPERRAELGQALSEIAHDASHSLDEAIEIAEIHGFDAYTWIASREAKLFSLTRAYNREQVARQALKNMDSALELDDSDRPAQRIGYLPKDAPRQAGNYLATLQRLQGKRRIEGRLSPLWAEGR